MQKIHCYIYVILLCFLFCFSIEAEEFQSDDDNSEIELNPYSNVQATYTPKQQNYARSISVGIGFPACGYANGIIKGYGCLQIEEGYLWLDLPIFYHYRVKERLALGVGLIPGYYSVAGYAAVGGALAGDIRFYAAKDWLYFNLNVMMGFPLLFAFSPSIGHSFPVTKKFSIYLENQLLMMAIAGFYAFWRPVLGVSFRF